MHPVPRYRYREWNESFHHVWRYPRFNGDGANGISESDTLHWHSAEKISDVSHSRATIKPVDHQRVSWRPMEFARTQTAPSSSWYYQTLTSGPNIWSLGREFVDPDWLYGIVLPSDGLRAEMADKAFDAFFTQVPQEIDIANALIDLRDLKDLIPKVEDTIVKTISGGFLNFSFGWKPLIGDIQALRGLLAAVRSRITWLKSTYGKRTPLGYSQTFEAEVFGPSDVFPLVFTQVASSATFTTGCYLTHRLERLDGIEGELRALLAATGLNSPGKILWERIPFSFIVDWVSRVGRFADKASINPFTGQWDITDVSHSFKQRVEYEVRWNSGWDFSLAGKKAGSLVYERYTRRQGIPLSSALFYGRELTPQQLALSAALIGAAS